MNLFSVFVIIYTIGNCYGQPVDQSNYQLQHFPQPNYQTQVIDYPGAVYTGQNVGYASKPQHVNSHAGYQHYQELQRIPGTNYYQAVPIAQVPRVVNTIPAHPITTTTTTSTTTPAPLPEIVEEEQPIEEIPVSHTQHHAGRRVRPQQQVTAAQRFQVKGQDFIDEQELPEFRVAAEEKDETEEERLLREKQNKNAHYTFGTTIDDGINDHSIHRQETRNGLALSGMYSYSDGFFHRTIHYKADENGYRVTKEEIVPIGDGPQFNPNGTADVSSDLHNNHVHYSITADDFVRERKNKTAIARGKEHL